MGKACGLLSGGTCISNAAAEAVFNVQPSELLPCCRAGCSPGSLCDAGWRSGGPYAYARVVARCGACANGGWSRSCGDCGNGSCDPGEYLGNCPQDCSCGDGVCDPREAQAGASGWCAADCDRCGDGQCDAWETPASCKQDCAGAVCSDTAAYPGLLRACGDGECTPGSCQEIETCMTCPQDCGPCDWVRLRGYAAWQTETIRGLWADPSGIAFAVGLRGVILRYDGGAWAPMVSGVTEDLWSVWGASPDDVFAVGGRTTYSPDFTSATKVGPILHFDGTSWSVLTTQPTVFWGVGGSSSTDVYAVGDGGYVLRYDGTQWTKQNLGTTTSFRSVWAASPSSVFVTGGERHHFDGNTWSPMPAAVVGGGWSLWGSSATDVYEGALSGAMLHYDGSSWSVVSNGPPATAIWGSAPGDVYAISRNGDIAHFDGSGWTATPVGAPSRLWAASGSSSTSVFAAGENGVIFRFDGVAWSKVAGERSHDLSDIAGSSASDLHAVGINGPALHYNGVTWTELPNAPAAAAVWAASPGDVFAAGPQVDAYHFDGTSWSPMVVPASLTGTTKWTLGALWGSSSTNVYALGWGDCGPLWGCAAYVLHSNGNDWTTHTFWGWNEHALGDVPLYGIWGASASDLFVVGGDDWISDTEQSQVRRYQASGWTTLDPGTTRPLHDVWGSSAVDVFAVGAARVIRHFDGYAWTAMTSGASADLRGVGGRSGGDVFAVGPSGLILHYDGSGWQRSRADLRQPSADYACPDLEAIGVTPQGDLYAVGSGETVIHNCPAGSCGTPGADAGSKPLDGGAPQPDAGPSGCPDGTCSLGESCDGRSATRACPQDCPGVTGGDASQRYCFVNGVCQGPGCP